MTTPDHRNRKTLKKGPAHPRTLVPIALSASAAAITAAALTATPGSAQAPPGTLHFVDKKQQGVGFFAPAIPTKQRKRPGPNGKPRQGDRFGFGDTVTGDDTGFDRAVCTVTGNSQALCTAVVQLSKGTLTAKGFVTLSGPANKSPLAITGGTGAYDGARGTALVTDVNQTTTNIEITLRT